MEKLEDKLCLCQIEPPFKEAKKVLVIAHREELIDQARSQISKVSPDLIVDVDKGENEAAFDADIIVGSVQTLGREDTLRLERYHKNDFKAIIIDEAHHAVAPSYSRILQHFGTNDKDSHILLWGCSATVRRYDGISLATVFDQITYHKDFVEMIKEKWLCDLKTKVIKTNIDISKIRANNDDFMLSDLSKCLNVKTRNDVIVRSYLEYALFAVDIEHVEKLRQAFLDAQIEAYSLTSKTPAHIRAEVIKKFREKKFSVLVNCGILTEGTDIPNIDCIIMGRPTKSPVLFQQMIGRGMRLHEGKKDCLILDFIDSSTKHIPDLVTSPTLLGLTTSNVLVGGERNDDQNAELIPIIPTSNGIYMNTLSPNDVIDKERIDRLTSQIKEISNINVEEYLSVNELIDDCSSASHIKVISDNAWVRVGYESYVLSLSIKGSIKLDRDTDGRFKAKYRSVKYKTKAKSDDVIPIRSVQPLPIIGDRLDTAIKACDSWVKFKFGNKLSFILASRFTRWRNQPITKQQLNWIKKRNPLLTDDKLCHLEKGSASNLMTQIIEGAEKNWEKFQKEKGKKEKLLKKLKSQTVHVGPLT
ncbi:2482_t:CDS:2 [Entrophospora sp. SA101]|nr:2482_t:CDS:2 [Entrophospora sp. SA101]